MSTGRSSANSSAPSSGASSKCSSATSGITVTAAPTDLPPSSYDGNHLHWKQFRREVLAPHRIRVVEGPPSHPLPESLIALIEASNADIGRIKQRRLEFRQQVTQGRGFGPSPLFPPNLLPSIDHEPQLARCMVPTFNRDALPERVTNHKAPLYELSVPRSGLGCGFSSGAFTADELSKIPRFLVASGTVVEFNTGYISSGASLYIPFLIFERTFGQKEYRLEAANNQCAIAGSWCTRSMQMLYAQAWSPQSPNRPELPVSFSCTIDNDIAIVNYHWIDHAQSYCMSPVCKFDLTNDDHFDQFNIWIEAIGQWGLRTLLPIIKNALSLVVKPPPLTRDTPLQKPTKLRLDTVLEEEKLVTALKTSFSSVAWRMEDDEFTPVSSSVASWGSPIINDMINPNVPCQQVPRMKSVSAGAMMSGRRSREMSQKHEAPIIPFLRQSSWKVGTPRTPQAFGPNFQVQTPQNKVIPQPREPEVFTFSLPKAAVNTELVWQKRFGHAMDEIQHLQMELDHLRQEVSGSSSTFQNELCGIKDTISCVLRKETMTLRARTPSISSMPGGWSRGPAEIYASHCSTDVHVITSPTDASPRHYAWDQVAKPSKRPRSALHKVMTVDTGIAKTISNRSTPCSPIPPYSAISIRSDTTNVIVVPPAPPRMLDLVKWSTALLSTHLVGSFIPSTVLRVVFLGCVTDFALLAWASPHWPSSTAYFLSLLSKSA